DRRTSLNRFRPPAGGRWPRPRLRRRGDDAHAQPAAAVILEPDHTVGPGEEGVVLAHPDVLPRLPLRAVLADEDRAALHPLAAVALDAEALGVAVAPVPARPLSLLVRHEPTSQKHWSGAGRSRGRSGRRLVFPGSELDAVDPQRGVGLTVAPRPPVVLPLLVLEHANLSVASFPDDGAHDRGLVEERRADLRPRLLPSAHQQHLAERDFFSDRGGEALEVDRVALLHAVLLAAGPHDRVHPQPPSTDPARTRDSSMPRSLASIGVAAA